MHTVLESCGCGFLPRFIAILVLLAPQFAFGQAPTSGSPSSTGSAGRGSSTEQTEKVATSGIRGRVFDANGQAKANATLIVTQMPMPTPGPTPPLRQSNVKSNAAGEFEVANLSAGLVKIEVENLRGALGTARQTVLLNDGQTRTIDLGGGQSLGGRLLFRGIPAANVRVRLSLGGESTSPFVAFALTNGDGAFTFWNVPPGKWEFAFETSDGRPRWNSVTHFNMNPSVSSLGDIDHRPVKVLVHCEPFELARPTIPNLDFRVFLRNMAKENRTAITLTSLPRNARDPFVFENVPPGQYEVIGEYSFRGGSPDVWPPSPRTEIKVTPDSAEQQVTLTFPQGTASVRGRMSPAEFLSAPRVLWNRNRSLIGFVQLQPDESFEIRGLPAGEYFLSDSLHGSVVPAFEFSLAGEEQKTITLPPELLRRGTAGTLSLTIVSQASGTPILGATLQTLDPKRSLEFIDFQDGRVHLQGFSGDYELEIGYPGFRSVRQRVTVPALSVQAAASPRQELVVELVPTVGRE
jgi:hypothetical protein